MASTRYEIQHCTLLQGWVNTWTDEDDKPMTFATEAEAQVALDEYLAEDKADMADGEEDYSYDPDDFRIVEVSQ